MRTTVDLPDELFRQAKSAAALRGESLKEFFLAAIKRELDQLPQRKKRRIAVPLVKAKTSEKIRLNSEKISEIFMSEDVHGLAGH